MSQVFLGQDGSPREAGQSQHCQLARPYMLDGPRSASLALAVLSVLALEPARAAAQPPRISVSAVFGVHNEDADHVTGSSPAAGLGVGIRLASSWHLEVEVSRPTGTGNFVRRSEAIGVSFAPPGSSRDEIERLGVLERFTREREVKANLFVGAVYQPLVHPRVQPRIIMGVFNRSVRDRFTTEILRLPEGVDPVRLQSVRPIDERHSRNIGGPSFGIGVAVAITRRLSVAPEFRYDYGSIGDEINNAWRNSLRIMWGF